MFWDAITEVHFVSEVPRKFSEVYQLFCNPSTFKVTDTRNITIWNANSHQMFLYMFEDTKIVCTGTHAYKYITQDIRILCFPCRLDRIFVYLLSITYCPTILIKILNV